MAEPRPGRPAVASHSPLQGRAGWALLVAVSLAHVLAANELATDRFGDGAGHTAIKLIEVAFVRDLQQAHPPQRAAAAGAAAPGARQALAAVSSAAPAASAPSASLPDEAPAPPTPPTPAAEPLPEPPPPAPAPRAAAVVPELRPAVSFDDPAAGAETAAVVAAAAVAEQASQASPAAPVGAAFDWPPSTRLSYNLSGDYRGPVQGTARVEWLRSGLRYQVQLEAKAALILTRRTTSEGELTDRGLVPQRFEGEQSVLLRTKRWRQQFLSDRVVLADGSEVPMQAGAQDEASQFVQLTWLFTTQPQLLKVGQSVDIPLVVNSRLDRWTYDIAEQQTLQLPFGPVETFHLKSRREAKGSDLTPEIWIAPSLQYLPVRILLRQGTAGHVDLMLERPPLQANR